MTCHLTVCIWFILLWVSDSSDTTAMEFFCVLLVSLSLNYVFLEDDMSCNMRIRCRVVQFGILIFPFKISKFNQAL
jgi:hypothetical protein